MNRDLVHRYVDDIVSSGAPVTSVVLFGSASTGGYADAISDVDLLIIVRDETTPEQRDGLVEEVSRLEQHHGFASAPARPVSRLQRMTDTLTANGSAFFVCTRADLLSGEPHRILGVSRAQASFVDRVAIPSIVRSGVTLYGEDLLGEVPLLELRRIDTMRSFFGLFNQVLLAAAVFPFLDMATKYAMDALKRSVHNCYFCFNLAPAALPVEIRFFEERYGPDATLGELLELRKSYRRSFFFILRTLPALVRLHWRTARDVPFPVRLTPDV